MSMAKYTVAVAGATGYAGGEALRILAAHPDFAITCVAGHSSVGESMAKHMPHIPQLANLVVEDTTPEVLNGHDVIILALPHGASGKLASQLDPNAVVVDLGADHRLEEQAAWDEFYGGDFYEHWTYGMPELITGKTADGAYTRQREALPGTKRIAGPGCNAQARTSNAPTCWPPRHCNPHCRTRWAARTVIFLKSCRISPMRPVRPQLMPASSRLASPRYWRPCPEAFSPPCRLA